MKIPPSPIQFTSKSPASFVEDFEFRGISADGRYGFLLRHSLQQQNDGALLTVVMLCFDKKRIKTHAIYEQQYLSAAQLKSLLAQHSWQSCCFSFASGAFFEISRDSLRGKLHSHAGSVSWHLRLHHQDSWWQLRNPLWYALKKWPPYKFQVNDSQIKYLGKIHFQDLDLATDFLGSNLHYWGKGYPVEYALAQCSQFKSPRAGFFYGFSSRLAVTKRLQSPYVSMASLKIGQHSYHFQQITRCFRHKVTALDDYRWHIQYQNADYLLDVEIEGANPRLLPWAAWQTQGQVSKTTELAQATFTLYRRDTLAVVECLHTDSMALQTHLPENMIHEQGFLVKA